MAKYGIKILRFTNREVLENTNNVIGGLKQEIACLSPLQEVRGRQQRRGGRKGVRHYLKRYFYPNFVFSGIFITFAPIIKYSFLTGRVFDFIKKGGEIRLGETLATHQQIVIKVPIPNPGKKTGDDKINTKAMDSIHLIHNNFIMPLMPMCMCRS